MPGFQRATDHQSGRKVVCADEFGPDSPNFPLSAVVIRELRVVTFFSKYAFYPIASFSQWRPFGIMNPPKKCMLGAILGESAVP